MPTSWRIWRGVLFSLLLGACTLPATSAVTQGPQPSTSTPFSVLTHPVSVFQTPQVQTATLAPAHTATPTSGVTLALLPSSTLDITDDSNLTPGTPSETHTPTPGSYDPNSLFGQPYYVDPLNNNSLRYWVGRDGKLPDTEFIQLSLVNGQLLVTSKKILFDTWWFSWPVLNDFYLEMLIQTDNCQEKDAFGAIVRGSSAGAENTNGYIIAFSCDGSYLLRRLDGTNPYVYTDLIPWTRSEHVRAGSEQTNRLGILAQGDSLTVIANGIELQTVIDSVHPSGRYGVFVNAGFSDLFSYRIRDFRVWQISH